jgi:hypothetical protein
LRDGLLLVLVDNGRSLHQLVLRLLLLLLLLLVVMVLLLLLIHCLWMWSELAMVTSIRVWIRVVVEEGSLLAKLVGWLLCEWNFHVYLDVCSLNSGVVTMLIYGSVHELDVELKRRGTLAY